MVLRKINNLVIVFIILCSASFYRFAFLGPIDKVAELMGAGLIVGSIILYLVYSSGQKLNLRRSFITPVVLILISLIPSMLMANAEHNQNIGFTLYAQRALYYYLFYFLLHYMKPDVEDIEKLFLPLGILIVLFYYAQVAVYPRLIFDGYVRQTRGTVRIYFSGADYMVVSYFMSVQYFLRTNRFKFLLLAIVFFSIFILMGGRQTMAIVVFVTAMFILIDRRVKSRFFIVVIGLFAVIAAFFIFQEIFEALVLQSKRDTSTEEGYVRFRAARFFLTEFMDNPWAYITGNGPSYAESRYGAEIRHYAENYGFYLGDIGIFGNYVVYGALFILGVLMICYRAMKIKIEENYSYVKYMLLTIILALPTSAGFTKADAICFIMIMLYIIDTSHEKRINSAEIDSSKPSLSSQ